MMIQLRIILQQIFYAHENVVLKFSHCNDFPGLVYIQNIVFMVHRTEDIIL